VLEAIDRKQLLPGLLPFVCQTNTFYNHAIGTSAGSLSPRTNWRSLSECEIALPSLEEQAQLEALLRAALSNLECILLASDDLTKVEQLAFEWLLLASPAQAQSATPTHFGRIPGHWQLKPVCEVGEVAYGISAAVSDNTDRGIGWPILTGANLTLKGEIDSSKLVYHPAPSKPSFILKANDILLNWRSGSPEHIGKTALFNLEGDWTYASFILRLRPNDDSNPVYLWRLFNFM
jgi:type I restriction enzyme S subunit